MSLNKTFGFDIVYVWPSTFVLKTIPSLELNSKIGNKIGRDILTNVLSNLFTFYSNDSSTCIIIFVFIVLFYCISRM
jgi:hypothetical protein